MFWASVGAAACGTDGAASDGVGVGYTVVNSVFVTNKRVVESAESDVGDGEGFAVGEPIELDGESGNAELTGTAVAELLAIVELAATLVACTLCDAEPG